MYRGREQVQIDTEKASEATGFSPAVISRLIAELVKLKVIKRVNVNNKYWINPMMIFKGNRVNYIRKQASKEEQKTLFNFIKSKEEQKLDDLNENKEGEPIKNT